MRFSQNKQLRERRIYRIKKVMVAAIAFLMILMISAVDRGYAELMGEEGKIIPQIRLKEEGIIKVTSCFGEMTVNFGCVKEGLHL